MSSGAVSVYYPFALVELVGYFESDDYGDTGDVLLVFLDSDGCQVTLRVARGAAQALEQRLSSPPEVRPD
jgi:hypothetical protein